MSRGGVSGEARRGVSRAHSARVTALGFALLLTGLGFSGVTAPPARAASTAADPPDYRQTKTLTREHLEADKSTTLVDTREVTVSVDVTTDLQNRERVLVSWTGAHPTGGRTADPYGEKGLGQEYPVVILECRGVENPAQGEEQLSPETCWTTSRNERNGAQSSGEAVWAHDRYADPERIALGGSVPDWPTDVSGSPVCETDTATFRNFLVPFRAASGTVYWNCFSPTTTTAPEQATDAALPANEVFASTALDGTGQMLFEVRTDDVNASLGCSEDVACSLVVIPIMGISCADSDKQCRKTGYWEPGTLRADLGEGYDFAVSSNFWWSESNWRNRFTVPLSFAPPPDVCNIFDDRPPVSFYGSYLLSQATLQWAPAYCLDRERFRFQHNRANEAQARRQVGTADAVAAFVSDPMTNGSLDVAYAPTAVTGFGIGFVIDKAGNAGEVTSLRLTPRLVAKLLSESYPAFNDIRNGHCDISGDADVEVLKSADVPARDAIAPPLPEGGCEIRTTAERTEKVDGTNAPVEYTTIAEGVLDLVDNPLSITTDPEFKALNPDVPARGQVSEAVLLSLAQDSDVVRALTSWIAADPAASSFLAGNPDEHGMRVNGYYKGISLPTGDWPLLDQYIYPIPPSGDTCTRELGLSTPNLQRYASPVATLQMTSEALLDAWPYSQVSGTRTSVDYPCKWSRPRLGYGTRFMLSLVPIADADRLGLHVAELRTPSDGGGAQFHGPTDAAMASALSAFSQEAAGEVFTADYSAMPVDSYPGTMIVHTAALVDCPDNTTTDCLDTEEAADVAEFIRVAITEGQVKGRGNGQLPDGYLPVQPSGPTAALYAAAQLSAEAIEKQDPSLIRPAPTATPTVPAFTLPVTGDPPATNPVTTNPVTTNPTVDGLPAADGPESVVASPVVKTKVDTSGPAGAVIPSMMGVALAGAVGAPILRRLSTRRWPR